jgi:hypothetical protein
MDFEALGQQLLDRKKELKKNGIPSDAEHAMVTALAAGAIPRLRLPAARPRRAGGKFQVLLEPAAAKLRNHLLLGGHDRDPKADVTLTSKPNCGAKGFCPPTSSSRKPSITRNDQRELSGLAV